jgi:hypothetical protein
MLPEDTAMPEECVLLKDAPYNLEQCPLCSTEFPNFMRGMVQRRKRFLGFLWKQDYCAIICHGCKNIVGWESPCRYTIMNYRINEICEKQFNDNEIKFALQGAGDIARRLPEISNVPENVKSDEFAEWLASRLRCAMGRGMRIGVEQKHWLKEP